jgi:hypothetical protein
VSSWILARGMLSNSQGSEACGAMRACGRVGQHRDLHFPLSLDSDSGTITVNPLFVPGGAGFVVVGRYHKAEGLLRCLS